MRVIFLDLPVDIVSMDETVARIREAMRSRRNLQHVALNVAKLVGASSDPLLKSDIETADIVGIDGMGIVIGLRLAGFKDGQRVAGIDLMLQVLALCAAEGFRPYFLGATRAVVERAAAAARERFPGLAFAGIHDGYFGEEEEAGIVAAIRASRADCLFVGMPTPRKERFLARNRAALGVPFIMGVGGSFDVLSGHVRRAPLWMQRAGLEWLYRLLQEPRRMLWRYASTNAAYAWLLCGVVARRIGARLRHRLSPGRPLSGGGP
jgi:N-acetylglucosaminyldiphosphoundecaprenol N-acetyl-beta-D-mannosaminyltransferase